MLLDDQELRERVGRIEALLEEIESLEDPNARAKTAEMVQTLLELYGEGLGRIVESVGRLGGQDLKDELARRRAGHAPPAPARPAPD